MTFRVHQPNDFTIEVTNWPGAGAVGAFVTLSIRAFDSVDTGASLDTNGPPTTIMHSLKPVADSLAFAHTVADALNGLGGTQ